ncbi:hypothetical protein Taro_042579, partial [Colocasia esculenta]|nr:hypothetical protein [Colocasia esculenta]
IWWAQDNKEVGLVQTRWSFVNKDENLLTRLQYINLCFHFEVEQQVNGVFLNFFGFNGIAEEGWQPTEESVPQSKNGVKGIYRVDVDIPADDWVNITDFYDVLAIPKGNCGMICGAYFCDYFQVFY